MSTVEKVRKMFFLISTKNVQNAQNGISINKELDEFNFRMFSVKNSFSFDQNQPDCLKCTRALKLIQI